MELNINQYSSVKAITEVDLRSLFDSSIENMNNGTFWFPAELNSNESKYEYFKNMVDKLFLDSEVFAYKRTIDGRDVAFHIGKRLGNAFVHAIGLITSIDGSKSWIYRDEAYQQQMQFLINNNFTGIIVNARKDSQTERHIIERYTSLLGAEIKHLNEIGAVRNTLITFSVDQA